MRDPGCILSDQNFQFELPDFSYAEWMLKNNDKKVCENSRPPSAPATRAGREEGRLFSQANDEVAF